MPIENYKIVKEIEAIIYKINRYIAKNNINESELSTLGNEINNCYVAINNNNQKLYVETLNLSILTFKNYFKVTF